MPVESPMVPWMGMAGGYPVYPANMYPQAYLDEMQNERDMKKMKELYPEVAKDVLSVVEDECDQMEYDGSMMFDEYPDKVMFERIKNRIYDKVQEKYPVEEEDDRDQVCWSSFYFFINLGNIITNDSKTHHDQASDDQDQKDHCRKTFYCMSGKITYKRFNTKHDRKQKSKDTCHRHKLHRSC